MNTLLSNIASLACMYEIAVQISQSQQHS